MSKNYNENNKWPIGLKVIAFWLIAEIMIGSFQLNFWIKDGSVFGSRYNLQTTYVSLVILFSGISFLALLRRKRKAFVLSILFLTSAHIFTILHYSLEYLWRSFNSLTSLSLSFYLEPFLLGSFLYIIFLSFVYYYIFKYELTLSHSISDKEDEQVELEC